VTPGAALLLALLSPWVPAPAPAPPAAPAAVPPPRPVPPVAPAPPQDVGASPDADALPLEARAYRVEHYEPPEGAVLEVGGLDVLSDGRVVLSTRRGQVWLVEDAFGDDVRDARFHLAAEGLHEGLGLEVVTDADGGESIYVLQRGELSRLVDEDGDARFETIETVANDWGLSGNYHEFAFGLPEGDDGHLWIGLNVAFFSPKWWLGASTVPWRGWVLRVDPATGAVDPFAMGFRSPCGLGTDARGELFVTDNQGDWMPAGPIFHVRRDGFHGHPASLAWTDEYRRNDATPSETVPPARPRAPAAVWLPYEWSRSAGNLVPAPADGAFGPFGGQMIVAELTNGLLLRTSMERVRGRIQGAAMLLRQEIGSVARVRFAPDGTLLCGLTNRGWGGLPPADGLARVRWTGHVPMEMRDVHLMQDGFEITFTRPAAPDVALSPGDVSLVQYDYDYWWEYGSPERHRTDVEVTSLAWSDDRRVLTLRTRALRPAMVARARIPGVRAADGAPLVHDEFAYTINELPHGPPASGHVVKPVPPPPPRGSGEEGWLRLTWFDALDAWQAEGWRLVDAELSPRDPTTFVIHEGVGALVNDGEAPTDLVGRYPLADGAYHIEFMLPEGGRSAVRLLGRYGIALVDEALAAAKDAPATGTILGPTRESDRPPASDVYAGAGRWHALDVELRAPRFDETGRRTQAARLLRVAIDDVVVHEDVELDGPSRGGPPGEVAEGPLVVDGTSGLLALRTIRVRPHNATTEPNPEAPAEPGWVPIFDGEDIDGWTVSPGADPRAWSVEDGVLTASGPPSHLFSPRGDYRDLEVRARVRIDDGGNSGMYVRAARGEGWPAGYEAQINASSSDPQKTGSLYGLAPVTVELVPPGTWFTQHVVCRDVPGGTSLAVRVNGVLVSEALDPERRHAEGHVALQHHHDGSVVEFASVEVRVLD